jgi:hypothetical protein
VSEARTLPDLVGSSQEADLKQAEEAYLQDKAARENLFAKSRRPDEMNLSQLMKKMYGDDSTQAVALPRLPSTTKEDANVKPSEAFPPPPTGKR